MKRPFWLVSGALGFALLLAIGFLLAYDRVLETELRPPGRAALENRFLAAERLLARLGVPSRRVAALSEGQLAPGAVLLLPAQRGAVSAAQLDRLEAFVRAGGHLVVESEPLPARDPVLDRFGIARHRHDWRQAYGYERFDWQQPTAAHRPGEAPLLEVAYGDGEPMVALFHGGAALTADGATVAAAHGDRAHLIWRAHGAGRVTALSDLQFAGNWQIGRHDHAELLWRLAAWRGEPSLVLFYRGTRPSLARWLGEHALPALVALALAVLLALWRAMPRFGPIAPDPAPVRRRLLDHLAASGRLLWAAGARGALLDAASRHALAVATAQQPRLARLPAPERAALLATRYGIEPPAAAALVARAPARDVAAAIARAAACRLIHAHGADGAAHRPAQVDIR